MPSNPSSKRRKKARAKPDLVMDSSDPGLPDPPRPSIPQFPAVTGWQVTLLWISGFCMIAASIFVFVFHTIKGGDFEWVDLGIHALLIGMGMLLMVPRRVLELLGKLPKFKWFGK